MHAGKPSAADFPAECPINHTGHEKGQSIPQAFHHRQSGNQPKRSAPLSSAEVRLKAPPVPQKASEPVINAPVQTPGFHQASPWHGTPGCLPSL